MPRDSSVYLEDIVRATERIAAYVAGHTWESFIVDAKPSARRLAEQLLGRDDFAAARFHSGSVAAPSGAPPFGVSIGVSTEGTDSADWLA